MVGQRAGRSGSLSPEMLHESNLTRIRGLNKMPSVCGQSLAQMALAWTLREPRVTSTLVGCSSVRQLEDNVAALDNLTFSTEELNEVDELTAGDPGVSLWTQSNAVGRSTSRERP